MVNARTLTELNELLANSFSAIRRDMEDIRRAQKEQLRAHEELRKELRSLEQGFVKKTDFEQTIKKIEDDSLGSVRKDLEGIQKRNDEIVALVNARISDLNAQFKKNIEIKDEISQIKKELLSKFKELDELFDAVCQLDKDLVSLEKRSTEKKEFNSFVKDTNKRIVKIKDEGLTREQADNLVNDVNKEFDVVKEKVDNLISAERFEKELAKLREQVNKINNARIPIKNLLERHVKKKKAPKKQKSKKKVSMKQSFY